MLCDVRKKNEQISVCVCCDSHHRWHDLHTHDELLFFFSKSMETGCHSRSSSCFDRNAFTIFYVDMISDDAHVADIKRVIASRIVVIIMTSQQQQQQQHQPYLDCIKHEINNLNNNEKHFFQRTARSIVVVLARICLSLSLYSCSSRCCADPSSFVRLLLLLLLFLVFESTGLPARPKNKRSWCRRRRRPTIKWRASKARRCTCNHVQSDRESVELRAMCWQARTQ